jgi:uncharacterized protein (TIGR02996 family)
MHPSRSLHQALEAELVANPDDLATHAAYADLLTEESDARGEFIGVQIALEDPGLGPAERRRLEERERELLASYHDRWLGPLAPFCRQRGTTIAFRRGWLSRLEVRSLSLAFARALRDAPQARLLREVDIRETNWEKQTEIHPDDGVPEEEKEHPGIWPLVGSGCLANVRAINLGIDDGEDYQYYRCSLDTEAIPLLLRGMPRLEEARLFANHYNLTEVVALSTPKELRLLQVYHCSRVHRLDVLANNPAMRHLTHLLCHPHALSWDDNSEEDEPAGFREEEGYLPLSVFRPLLHSPHLARLTHLQLRCSSVGDEGCAEIVRSGILKRLKMLDLRHGRITDTGARTLAECPDIRGLEHLDLAHNSLSAEGVALVKGLGISVSAEGQPTTMEDDSYLYEGDTE